MAPRVLVLDNGSLDSFVFAKFRPLLPKNLVDLGREEDPLQD
jgi:hypothetical protein